MPSFADQAVIAIENVRLFDEIQNKSRQLAERSQHKSQFVAFRRSPAAATTVRRSITARSKTATTDTAGRAPKP
jgi:GAF domain-containing protein